MINNNINNNIRNIISQLSILVAFILIITFNLFLFDNQLFAENKKVVLATDCWEPHYGSDLENEGYFTEITKEAFKRVGYNCEVSFVPWKRALELAKRGQYDGLLGAFYSKERTEFFEYSTPIYEEKLVFFSKNDKIKKEYSSLQDLKGYIIGTVRGYHYSDEFNNAKYLIKDTATRASDNIRRLMLGRLDLILASQFVVIHTVRKKYPDHVNTLIKLDPPLVTHKLYVPISKKNRKHKQIVQDLNLGLKIIKEDCTFDNIMKKHGFH